MTPLLPTKGKNITANIEETGFLDWMNFTHFILLNHGPVILCSNYAMIFFDYIMI
jgi:hypothetical protein